MQELINKIGINTELLQSEPLDTLEQTLVILGVSLKTLWNYQKSNF